MGHAHAMWGGRAWPCRTRGYVPGELLQRYIEKQPIVPADDGGMDEENDEKPDGKEDERNDGEKDEKEDGEIDEKEDGKIERKLKNM